MAGSGLGGINCAPGIPFPPWLVSAHFALPSPPLFSAPSPASYALPRVTFHAPLCHISSPLPLIPPLRPPALLWGLGEKRKGVEAKEGMEGFPRFRTAEREGPPHLDERWQKARVELGMGGSVGARHTRDFRPSPSPSTSFPHCQG